MRRLMTAQLAVCALTPLTATDFNRDVRPVLSARCFVCHGPDAANRKAGLRLDVEAAAKALQSGKRAIAAGDPQASEALRRVLSSNPTLRMPPAYLGHDALTAKEIDVLTQWIKEGAAYQKHWSFLSPTRKKGQSIDSIVRARLEREGLKPAPEADRPTLIRRVSLDLTGLPPTPAEIDAFITDTSPRAYEKVVDRLLASPRYAERMAIRWLEAARYADTNGYQSDGVRSMWRWRDWVIQAFDRNMPFDKFTIEQIAGDLLPNATLDQKIASAFHRNHRTNAEGGIVEEEFRVEYVADRVETTATVWLGLTMGCARCHDHKYDPMTQKEFYQLFAFYNNVPERGLVYNFGNEEPFLPAPTPEHSRILAGHDAKLSAAEAQWKGLQPRVANDQREWEKQIRHRPTKWSLTEGQVLHLTLDDGGEPGKAGAAARLDGVKKIEAGTEIAKFDYMDPFTLAAWIKPESPNGTIVSRSEDYFEGEGYQWFLMDGKLRLHITRRFTDISLRIETAKPLSMNEWQHVAVTYDGYRKGSGVKMYVNGTPRELTILFDELTYPFGPKEPFRVGKGAGDKYLFRGLIDDVRVFKTALTADQASTLPVLESVDTLAAIPEKSRTAAQAATLRLCFLSQYAAPEIRESLATLEKVRKERTKYSESIPTVMVMKESGKPRETFVLKRGAYDQPSERVYADTPAFLPAMRREYSKNRLGLAKWLVDSSNPLPARVTVNRFWQMLFGTGLVKSVEDFGAQGEWPEQQDLLDWLAVEFVESGWNVKHMLKTIVMSGVYRQSSRVSPELLQRDPENRLFARGPRQRLSHEMLRDQALAVSGLLVEKTGGPSVKPYQPPGLWQELSGGRYVQDKGEGLYRRSLYTFWKRTVAPPSMILFDSPTRENCIVRESRTNTPLQALNLMNDVTYLEASRRMAERLMKEGGEQPAQRLKFGFRLVTSRLPEPREFDVVARAFDGFRAKYSKDTAAAEKVLSQGDWARDKSLDAAELAAYAAVCSLLLNLDETVTKQ